MALMKRVYASGTSGARNGPSSLSQPTARSAPTSASPIRETLIRTLPPRVVRQKPTVMRLGPPAARRNRRRWLFPIALLRCKTQKVKLSGEQNDAHSYSSGHQVRLPAIQCPSLHTARVFALESNAFTTPARCWTADLRDPPDVQHEIRRIASGERAFQPEHTRTESVTQF